MMNRIQIRRIRLAVYAAFVIFLLGLLACASGSENNLISPTTTETPAAVVLPTAVVTVVETPLTVAPTATHLSPSPTPTSLLYQVAFVETNDVLNVRAAPGVANAITGELAADATGIQLTGLSRMIDGSTWVSIASPDGVAGWVNSYFLTAMVAADDFCHDEATMAVLTALQTAVEARDGEQLAQLIHPERGLHIYHNWWNPGVYLSRDEASQIFTSDTSYHWGTADGSGLDLEGSFGEIILPMLDEDLLMAAQTACNDIIHGGTAGYVRLPDGYEAVNYYALYRPDSSQDGFDWGTWVVGVEQWQEQVFIRFLVHFEWEI